MKTTMDICLCGPSALELWRDIDQITPSHADEDAPLLATNHNPISPPRVIPTRELAASLLPKGLVGLTLPIHALVNAASLRGRGEYLASHVYSQTLPVGSVALVGPRAGCCTPALFLAQMASHADLPRLIRIAYEVCGSYSIMAESWQGFRERVPLATTRQLLAYAIRSKGIPGMQLVIRALKHVNDGSASPMETSLTMLLCLPGKLGGFGLPKPLLNHPLPLSEKLRIMTGRQQYVPDLYWPEGNVAVEYDGADYHSSEEQIADDLRRRNILTSLGITVIVVRKEQLRDWRELEHLARTVASFLGKRVRPRASNWMQLHGALRREVLGRHS